MVAYFSILKISNYQATIRLKSGRILGNLRLYSNMELLIENVYEMIDGTHLKL